LKRFEAACVVEDGEKLCNRCKSRKQRCTWGGKTLKDQGKVKEERNEPKAKKARFASVEGKDDEGSIVEIGEAGPSTTPTKTKKTARPTPKRAGKGKEKAVEVDNRGFWEEEVRNIEGRIKVQQALLAVAQAKLRGE
jgi:hypothetical protein